MAIRNLDFSNPEFGFRDNLVKGHFFQGPMGSRFFSPDVLFTLHKLLSRDKKYEKT